MAYLFDQHTETRCYLYAHHSFGRFTYSVDTLITHTCVSKIHAIIEWRQEHWVLRDLSSNGTWVNNRKLEKENEYILQVGDRIRFIGNELYAFVVKDLSPPSDALLPCIDENSPIHNSDSLPEAITLHSYHLLPSEQAPEIVLILNQQSGQWRVEYINQSLDGAETTTRLLQENDYIVFGNRRWKLMLSHVENNTELQYNPQHTIADLAFIFDLSLNEESTTLKVKTPKKLTDLQERAHHYLTLSLARYKVADARKGIASENQGWVNTDRLIKDLGVDMSHLNIQIHRTRKQFMESFIEVCDADNIIERQLRQVRFAGSIFEIYKGHQLESALPQQILTEH
jgi:hypothetical protein